MSNSNDFTKIMSKEELLLRRDLLEVTVNFMKEHKIKSTSEIGTLINELDILLANTAVRHLLDKN
jgi:hypothetical protein